jgi:2'-5' RNA ligase
MTTARRGISEHKDVEIYEVFHQQARRLGDSNRDADRASLLITFRFGGMTAEQAVKAADEIAAQRNAPPVKVTLTDQN